MIEHNWVSASRSPLAQVYVCLLILVAEIGPPHGPGIEYVATIVVTAGLPNDVVYALTTTFDADVASGYVVRVMVKAVPPETRVHPFIAN